MNRLLIALLFFFFHSSYAQHLTKFEQSGGTQTPTYTEVIQWWKTFDAASPYVSMKEMGPTDAGYPLHLILVSWDRDFNIASIKRKKKTVILVNNGIHPGEPDGIDASMLLVREITNPAHHIPENIVLAIIPVYNIGGTLNRSATYRVDQNGPEEFGFRGNSQNLDLNRDFIKCDSREAMSFAKIFHYLDPDIFLDNHVSNGADYQHVMTLICTQHTKLGGPMGGFMNKEFEPGLYASMKAKGYDMIPYVNAFNDTPDNGWPEFFESPRYGSGYAALWHTFSFVAETHMLKPYDQRVKATYELMKSFIDFTNKNSETIRNIRNMTKDVVKTQVEFPIAWALDRSIFDKRLYKGYTAARKQSDVSGLPRLFYDRTKPYEKSIPFYNNYKPSLFIQKPKAYVIPQGWWKVIERLQANNVQMRKLPVDTTIEVECYRLENYQSGARPFEGHHLNTAVQISKTTKTMFFRKGDWYIPMNQMANRFLVETLEPQAEDSYFAWNFFDPVLGQKEGFSDYVFEETATEFLKKNPEVEKKLAARKAADSAFAKNGRAQLNFVFQNSPYYESAHLQYPVYRVR